MLFGNRIVDIHHVLKWALPLQYKHSKVCTAGRIVPVAEKISGFCSRIILQCTGCDAKFQHGTQPQTKKSLLDTSFVWGTVVSGSTYGQTSQLLFTMDVPVMSSQKFYKVQDQLAQHWEADAWRSMKTAGAEEYKIATDEHQLDDTGKTWTSVYVDGGWSKRSYGHSYNAASGAVCCNTFPILNLLFKLFLGCYYWDENTESVVCWCAQQILQYLCKSREQSLPTSTPYLL